MLKFTKTLNRFMLKLISILNFSSLSLSILLIINYFPFSLAKYFNNFRENLMLILLVIIIKLL